MDQGKPYPAEPKAPRAASSSYTAFGMGMEAERLQPAGAAAGPATAITDTEEPRGAEAAELAGGPESDPATCHIRCRYTSNQRIVKKL